MIETVQDLINKLHDYPLDTKLIGRGENYPFDVTIDEDCIINPDTSEYTDESDPKGIQVVAIVIDS